MEIFAAAAIALYVGHHVGDYWIQTDHQAKHKGDAGSYGRLNCLLHVISYVMTQVVTLLAVVLVTGMTAGVAQLLTAVAISGITHYMADRREHGLMFWLARRIPGKVDFLRFGQGERTVATGAWALDQSWHIFFGVFIPALVLAA